MKQFLSVLRNRNMGLLLSGQFVSATGDWFYSIAASVAVFQLSGQNSLSIGGLWIARLVPAILFGTISGSIADRLGPRRAMIIADLSRFVLIGVLVFTLNGHTWVSLYPIAFLNSVFSGLFRPANVALIPAIVRSSDERLSANAVLMQIESAAGIIGSALGGTIAAAGHVQIALILDALSFVVSAASIWAIRPGAGAEEAEEEGESEGEAEEMGSGFLAGVRFLATRPILLFVAGVMIFPELATGCIMVWIVPYAENALHLGPSGIGYLYAVSTVGGLLGGFVAAGLGSNLPLDRLLALGVAVVGIGTVVFGLVQVAVVAIICIAIIGIAETVQYAAADTLLQQAVPEDAIGRATGTMDSLFVTAVLVGNAVSGLLASTIGLTLSITGLGILILLGVSTSWLVFRAQTAGRPNPAFLAKIPVFENVPVDVREWAVRRMVRERVPVGTVIIRQGDEGDRFYTIAKGRVEVSISQNGQTLQRELGPGNFFGEIALLHNVPRTATITALEPVTMWTMSREDFQELQTRASEFKESLWEAAASRLRESTDLKMALATRS